MDQTPLRLNGVWYIRKKDGRLSCHPCVFFIKQTYCALEVDEGLPEEVTKCIYSASHFVLLPQTQLDLF